jgi:hypothetical protein
MIAAANVSVANDIVTVNSLGSFVVGDVEAATVSAAGNITSGNLLTGGLISATGQVTGSQFNGSGAGLTAIPAANVTGTLSVNTTGSAASLTTARAINGTNFNGTAAITTANWGTARNITIGANTKSVNGSTAYTWTLAEIGVPQWTAATTAPASPTPGSWWYNTTNNAIYLYVDTGTSNVWIDQSNPTVFETVTTGAILNSNANGVGNIGTDSGRFNTVFARASSASYADLAEIYSTDANYDPGTVVVFGGKYEVTMSTKECDTRVAGVVSTRPAYVMNADADGVTVALTGRVPCRVQGPVNKGDVLITSSVPGVAKKIDAQWAPGCVIGKSLDDIDDDSVQTIEIAIGRF